MIAKNGSDANHPDDEAGDALQAEFEKNAQTVEAKAKGPRIRHRIFADIDELVVPWLWPGRIALGRMTALVGKQGLGKSSLTCEIAARVSRGERFPDGAPCAGGAVLLLECEGSPESATRPRLRGAGADLTRVICLDDVQEADGTNRPIRLKDGAMIEAKIDEIGDVRLLIVDPIGDLLDAKTDSHQDAQVRAELAYLADVAKRKNVAVLIVMHERKSGGNALDSALGSAAFTAKPRSVLHLYRDPDDTERRLLAQSKSNEGRLMPTLAFTLESTSADEPPRACWVTEPDPRSADEIAAEIALHARPARSEKPRTQARTWLGEELAFGPLPSKEVFERANAAGFSANTVRRAADELGVKTTKLGFREGWEWSLPLQDRSEEFEDT